MPHFASVARAVLLIRKHSGSTFQSVPHAPSCYGAQLGRRLEAALCGSMLARRQKQWKSSEYWFHWINGFKITLQFANLIVKPFLNFTLISLTYCTFACHFLNCMFELRRNFAISHQSANIVAYLMFAIIQHSFNHYTLFIITHVIWCTLMVIT